MSRSNSCELIRLLLRSAKRFFIAMGINRHAGCDNVSPAMSKVPSLSGAIRSTGDVTTLRRWCRRKTEWTSKEREEVHHVKLGTYIFGDRFDRRGTWALVESPARQATIAQVLFFVFLVLFIISLIVPRVRPPVA